MKGVFMDSRKILITLAVIHEGNWEAIYNALHLSDYPDEYLVESVCKKIDCGVLTILDSDYPCYLREMYRPPFVLFYHGDITLINNPDLCLAVVGTRDPSERGVEITREIVRDTCKHYITVSGLASGIDRVAHQTALENGGKTIAVLGCGPDYCFPSENRDIYEEIKQKGLLLSEFPPKVPPAQDHFPVRNRIIAMLSKAILVTEAKLRSGTSITVNFGLIYNRDVMCVPSSDLNNSVCNKFLKEGAILVENSTHVLDALR